MEHTPTPGTRVRLTVGGSAGSSFNAGDILEVVKTATNGKELACSLISGTGEGSSSRDRKGFDWWVYRSDVEPISQGDVEPPSQIDIMGLLASFSRGEP